MTRHSKNAGHGAVFSRAERAVMEHGSVRARLGAGALRAWDQCALTLARAQDPVVTPHGVLYDRAAVLSALVAQRGGPGTAAPRAAPIEPATGAEADGDADAVHRALPAPPPALAPRAKESSFWVPGVTVPSARAAGGAVSKPRRRRRRCPVSGRTLRARELVALAPTPAASPGVARYICPVCRAALTNAARPVALATGRVLCAKCVEQFVRSEGVDPISGEKVDPASGIIPIRHGGTSFAASEGEAKEASVYRPSAR